MRPRRSRRRQARSRCSREGLDVLALREPLLNGKQHKVKELVVCQLLQVGFGLRDVGEQCVRQARSEPVGEKLPLRPINGWRHLPLGVATGVL